MPPGRTAAFWFGPEESPLFGTLHLPEAAARGVIVLCPPLGREYAYSHATFLQLANRLAQLGLAALRFDYRSTGDSFDRASGESDGFARDVRSAVEFARTLGVAHVGIVGMRLGAEFLNVQPGPDYVDAAVLWDPCPTGRSFLREQRALALFAGVRVADENTDALDLPAFKVSADMAAEITRMDMVAGDPGSAETGRLSQNVLLLTRSERASDRKLAERFSAPPRRVERDCRSARAPRRARRLADRALGGHRNRGRVAGQSHAPDCFAGRDAARRRSHRHDLPRRSELGKECPPARGCLSASGPFASARRVCSPSRPNRSPVVRGRSAYSSASPTSTASARGACGCS